MKRLSAALGTTAFRLSVVYLATFVTFALVLIVFVGQRSTDILVDQARNTIATEVESLRRVYGHGGVPLLFRQVNRKARQPGANLFLITDANGAILAGNVRRIDPEVLESLGWTEEPFQYERFEVESLGDGDEVPVGRKYLATAQVNRLPNEMRLLVGRDVEEARRMGRVLDQTLQLALALMVVGALLAWLLVGRQALKRIDGLSESSDRILSGDDEARLPVGSSNDEFDRLSARMNQMLDRISTMNAGLKQVADSIAHDLKTPLTRLRNRAENALARKGRDEEDEEELRAIIAEADHLIGTFNALLTISRVEAGARTANFDPLDLAAIARDVQELYEPLAEEAGATLQVGRLDAATVKGSRELLAQALTNLVENAIKYGSADRSGARILIEVERRGPRVLMSVEDDGPGIPPEEREHVTERFVRLDESRNKPGTGLGLSLVKAIVGMHGGELSFRDAAPGLRAEIVLPAGTPRPAATPRVRPQPVRA